MLLSDFFEHSELFLGRNIIIAKAKPQAKYF